MSELVAAAIAGDADAWRALLTRYGAVVVSVARAHSLSDADAADVAQTTWLRLAQQLDRVRDPRRLGGWLATTARRESLKLLALRRRELPFADVESVVDGPEVAAITAEIEDALWRAVRGLPAPCRTLLRLIADAPDLSYAQAAKALGIRASSVGPIRGRCLAVMRRRLECQGVTR